jgi:hypothetical protein
MGDLLTRVTIWLALGLFAAAQIERRRAAPATSMTGRWLFSVGCSLYLAHVVLAFDVHYGWSHAIAYAETAIQTEAFTGLRWGWGIYVSYLFSAIWVGETAWWWLAPEGYHTRVHRLDLAMRAFFLFTDSTLRMPRRRPCPPSPRPWRTRRSPPANGGGRRREA